MTTDAVNKRAPLVRFEDVALGYGHQTVLEHLTLTLSEGDYLGIVGPNGSGKSTILKAMLGIIEPQGGRIIYEREVHRELEFGYVPQRYTVDEIYPLTVREIVRMARYADAGILQRPGRDGDEIVHRALEAVGIVNLADRRIGELSGGQRQRALISRALATEANCLVLDEPTDGMDLASQHAILELIARLHREEGLTVVFVSHLLNEVANYADRLALLEDGRFEYGRVEKILTDRRLSELYSIPVHVERLGGANVIMPKR